MELILIILNNMEKIAIKVTSAEQGRKVIEYLKSLGGVNDIEFKTHFVGRFYRIGSDGVIYRCQSIPKGYTEAFLPEEWKPTEQKLPEDIKTFRATAALMRLSFYKIEDEERFSKAVRDADELIKELNK